MVKNPPERTQRIVPMLSYDDAPAAITFLCEAFGFEERFRLEMPDGRLGHAELSLHGDLVMLASAYPEMGLTSAQALPSRHAQLNCYVDDVDAHYAHAKAAGATIATEPEDQFHGSRSYRAVDPEGHRWIFATHTRDVPIDELKAAVKGGA